MCSFDILLPIGGAVSLVSGCCFVGFGVLFRCYRGAVLNFRGLDFNFTKVTILLHIPQYLFPFFQLLNSEAYRLRVVFRSPPDQIAFAVQSDSVRRPIGFRPPSDRIPFAVRSDSVRHPIRFRPPPDQISFAARWKSLKKSWRSAASCSESTSFLYSYCYVRNSTSCSLGSISVRPSRSV